ncbi:Creatinase/aminopeptidase [Gonapodya prolifera JEL478]|uniref:Creatinase/aminopeptidase n=1 Tax=Gonapodya prolifera (strain JEL478) TaxID=1344416 RepID=A0A139AR36_GONPJ|nr:Creatinase/aminopeptidase [Gonapodya prolifera JEL478]|eukprot:KXS19196.1 Creatinase/aminopeptidase [Gonapodya prolifera JEL478]
MPAAKGPQSGGDDVKRLLAAPVDTSLRLKHLRDVMKDNAVTAYIIPTEDPHQSEYIADCDKRRAWISGFTGSAGTAVVTASMALLWTDGRYFLQASQQLDANWTLMKSGLPEVLSKEEWLAKNLDTNSRIGFDPKLVSTSGVKALRDALREAEATTLEVVSFDENLVDKVWADRPPRPSEPVKVLGLNYTGATLCGKLSEEKIADMRAKMLEKGAAVLIVTALDEVAWLFNLRGADISYNPVFFSFALLTADDVYLYVDEQKLSSEVIAHLNHVTIRPYDSIYTDLVALGSKLAIKRKGPKVWMDGRSNFALRSSLGKDVKSRSPLTLAKAIKNPVELEGFRQCHLRDGAAVCNFLGWLEHELTSSKNTSLTEWEAAQVLEGYRRQQTDFVGLSFETISSTGSNAAIIHYSPEKDDCSVIDANQIYLLDSGGQYNDGTTDTTRTLHFGSPTAQEKDAFTRVLKGHIALDMTVFPKGTTGYVLDAIARRSLWQAGLDYRHGTGHGVGSYLNVHEGPHGIGTRITLNEVGMVAGMTITNEPGYYADGKFGIRIENLLLVRDANTANNFGDRGYLGFEHVTMVPIQTKLIDGSLLNSEERDWVNKYNVACWEKISPLLEKGSLGWLWLEREARVFNV